MMKSKLFLVPISCLYLSHLTAQKFTSHQLAVFTTQSAYPFDRFAGLFQEIVHPGIEYGLSKNLKTAKHHDWFWDVRGGVFYHRFVQTAIPVYSALGYRYKLSQRWETSTALGAGYLHSIPATGKYKLNSEGDYENNKGIGRAQATVSFEVAAGYHIALKSKKQYKLFIAYQQRLQLPFIKSYVPLLPYNSFLIGCSTPIIKRNKQ